MLCIVFLAFITRNYLLLHFIKYGTHNKPAINNDMTSLPKEDYPYEFHLHVASTTAVETITHILIKDYIMIDLVVSNTIYYEVFYFVPISFCFEVVFDLFHYIGHRFLHDKRVYKYLHKKHHRFKHPIAITTFYQDPFDLLITNSIPTMLALCIVPKIPSFLPKISYLQFHMILVYKSFIEIGGHSGKISYPTTSFPQCIWLPRFLGIELSTEDHNLHHSLNNCNYAKRFSLWDKVFNTYVWGSSNN
jgi:sterol desaturase/sphingolipid hydroxylase (fatty acid hydroxylase superfamily)